MAAVLSYKEFMEEVRMRLKNYSTEDLQNLILSWAGEEHPARRQEFLSKLMAPKQINEVFSDVKTLLDEIAAFVQRVENGDYCDGWGWDDAIYEERDWGDESWAEEMDVFFLEARSLLLQGKHKPAEEAYRNLFSILEMGHEPGYLPGDPDSSNMLRVDIVEHFALFLRSVYHNSPLRERPALLYAAMDEYGYQIKLSDIVNALDAVLPDFDAFLAEWIDFLKNQK